jgi:elongation factor P
MKVKPGQADFDSGRPGGYAENLHKEQKMIKASDLRDGMCIRLDGELYKVVHSELKIGTAKLPSSVHAKLRNLHTHTQTEQRLHPEAKVEDIAVETVRLDYSYRDAEALHFLHPETFEDVAIPKRMLGNYEKFISDDSRLPFEFFGDEPLDAVLPRTVDVVVASTGPALHSDQNSAPKSATIENGLEVLVPQFIKNGDRIRLDLETGKYLERLH